MTEKMELNAFADDRAMAATAASAWLEALALASRASRQYRVALSGGRIAGTFFGAVVEEAQKRPDLFAFVHFFWADERCVPPEDTESNFRVARERLLAPLGIADGQIHRIRGEKSPAVAAAEAEGEIRRFAPSDSTGQPVLDLIFLGMGEDGHVASLFPGEPPMERNKPAIYRAVIGPKPPPQRITLGYAAITAARQVWVLVSGAGKEAALRESLRANGQTPLAEVLRSRSRTRILTDVALERTE